MSKFENLRVEAEVAIAQNWFHRLHEEDAKAVLELLAIQAQLVADVKEILASLQAANDDCDGPITDTIWMRGARNETVFEAIENALSAAGGAIMSKNNGGPAFPIPGLHDDSDFNGMSLRDYLAGKVLQGLCANPGGPFQASDRSGWELVNCTLADVVEIAYKAADAALVGRAK